MTQQENTKIKTLISILLFIFIWFFVYAFLHEAGHAIVGIAYGGTIENFVFWNFNAHVSIVDANYGEYGRALMNAAGVLFPRIIFVIAIWLYNSNIKFPGYHLCYFTAILSLAAGAFAGWVVIPIRSMFTLLPSEDAFRFLDTTGFHPILVALMCLMLIAAFVVFAHSRGIFTNAWLTYNSLLGKEITIKSTKIKWKFVSIGLMLSAIIIFVIALYVPYSPSSVFNTSVKISDVRIENSKTYTFTADGTRRHLFHLDIQGQGFMTGFIVEDIAGNRYYSGAFEETSSVIGLVLSEGVYNVRFIFLTDFEAVTNFFKEFSSYERMDSDILQSFRQIFYSTNNDYSVTYSLRIR